MNAPTNPPSPLYIWLGTDPLGTPPDTEIEDVPGVSDLQLLGEALAGGRFGTIIPAKIALSPHRSPSASGYRSVDVARLLRDLQIPHRRCYELLPRGPAESEG
ncbi:MAG TPA: hypothetical protein VFU72_16095 [Nitrolancea sp.]|nr:hypothetical protein [Nitrolancea sp.]